MIIIHYILTIINFMLSMLGAWHLGEYISRYGLQRKDKNFQVYRSAHGLVKEVNKNLNIDLIAEDITIEGTLNNEPHHVTIQFEIAHEE